DVLVAVGGRIPAVVVVALRRGRAWIPGGVALLRGGLPVRPMRGERRSRIGCVRVEPRVHPSPGKLARAIPGPEAGAGAIRQTAVDADDSKRAAGRESRPVGCALWVGDVVTDVRIRGGGRPGDDHE